MLFFEMTIVIFDMFKGLNNDDAKEIKKLLEKLQKQEFDIPKFYNFQRVASILLYINHFYTDRSVSEIAEVIATIKYVKEHSKKGSDISFIEMEYIEHCARHRNYVHIWNYLKEKIVEMLSEMLE